MTFEPQIPSWGNASTRTILKGSKAIMIGCVETGINNGLN